MGYLMGYLMGYPGNQTWLARKIPELAMEVSSYRKMIELWLEKISIQKQQKRGILMDRI